MDSDNILAGTRVLVLAGEDSDLSDGVDFSALLESIDCRSAGVASSAAAAFEIAGDWSRRPDIVVADLGCVSDDFDVCGVALQLRDGFGIPSLIAMARSDIGRMNQAITARPSGYLNKPFSQATLRETLQKALPVPQPKVQSINSPAELSRSAIEGAGAVGAAGIALAGSGLGLPSAAVDAPSVGAGSLGDLLSPLISGTEAETAAPPLAPVPAPSPSAPSPATSASPSATKPPSALGGLPSALPGADPTAHKRAARGQQLQGLGYLGRGFAHEFNNLLTVLIGNLSLAQDRYESGEAGSAEDSELSAAMAAAERGRRMVQQLLTFAKGGQPVRDVVRVADLARGVLATNREAHPSIYFQFQCTEPDLKVSVDRDQILRLLENLVTNAVQAIPGSGTVIVRVFTATDTQIDRIRPGSGQSGLEYLLIEVIDTGIGMDEETVEHAFDPYFTTRGKNNATGIGLTVCESIAKAHGGFLVLQSKPNRGTIAAFHLPMNASTARPDIFQLRDAKAPASAPQAIPPTAADPFSALELDQGEGIPGFFSDLASEEVPTAPAADVAPTGDNGYGMADEGVGRRVLVMEDDAMIRRLVARCLGRAGYDVVETTNGQDALDMHDMAKAQGRPFDLILSDLTIEDGMGGIEMMQVLRQRDQAIRAIVSSGYADSPAMARPSEYGFDAVLPKPYPPGELLRSVASTLAGDGVTGG